MNSGAAGFIPISGGGAASIAKTPSLWNSIKNIPSMIKVFGPNLWKKLLGAKDNVLKNGADVLKYLEDLTAEKLVASNGQVLTKSQADELLGKVGGSGASAADWMSESPNFKNGVYEIIGDVQREGDVLNLALKNGKFGSYIPGKSYLGSVPSDYPLDFVLLADGKTLKFGKQHSFLSGENSVRYAGQIQLSEGKSGIKGWNNGSGHFETKLTDLEGIDLVRSAFKDQFGIDLPNIKHFNQEL